MKASRHSRASGNPENKNGMPVSTGMTARAGYPDFSLEDQYTGIICGIDEVGRGPLAGPVVAACVIIPRDQRHHDFISEIRDSKKLSFKKLHDLNDKITHHFPHAIAEISPAEIDDINILQASLKAMAYHALLSSRTKRSFGEIFNIADPSHVYGMTALVDGNRAPKLPCPVTTVVKGDSKSVSIAAASIIAKVYRDRLMTRLALEYPHYGWERNVGYPAPEHLRALQTHGITPHHRKSFAPVRRMLEGERVIASEHRERGDPWIASTKASQ
jgi:ribonuclease HII